MQKILPTFDHDKLFQRSACLISYVNLFSYFEKFYYLALCFFSIKKNFVSREWSVVRYHALTKPYIYIYIYIYIYTDFFLK